MTIKGGARPETVFHTVQMLMKDGLTVQEAIEKVESILCGGRGHLPEHIKSLIRQECK